MRLWPAHKVLADDWHLSPLQCFLFVVVFFCFFLQKGDIYIHTNFRLFMFGALALQSDLVPITRPQCKSSLSFLIQRKTTLLTSVTVKLPRSETYTDDSHVQIWLSNIVTASNFSSGLKYTARKNSLGPHDIQQVTCLYVLWY